jgi:hypothetical protein
MKKVVYILLIGLVSISCGGSGDDPPPPPAENRAPSTPSLTAPADELLCVDNTVQFQWSTATDPDGDNVSYQIQIATDNSFSNIVETRTVSVNSASITLEDDKAYYWRVRASDSKNANSNYTSIRKFYTYGVGVTNHLPFAPTLVAPLSNAIVTPNGDNVTLQWTASDVDTADSLSFDVFWGTDNPPTENTASVSTSELEITVAASTSYFWKVIVKDNAGGETIGQIWSFRTD